MFSFRAVTEQSEVRDSLVVEQENFVPSSTTRFPERAVNQGNPCSSRMKVFDGAESEMIALDERAPGTLDKLHEFTMGNVFNFGFLERFRWNGETVEEIA